MTSAILLRITARSAGAVRPQAGAAACAASRAFSMSAPVDRATSQNGWPLTGDSASKYLPSAGATQSPPMKFS